MILSVQHLSKSFLEVPVLSDITFHLEKGDRAAIVGINGAGKSTLLKIMMGEMKPDEGSVSFARDTTIGYLAQNQDLGFDGTIYEELLTVKKDIVDLEKKIEMDEKLMAQLTGAELEQVVIEYNELLTRFQNGNGFSYKGEITGVLRGLGFSDEEFDHEVATLSGGQKTRVALAKLLLEKPDIILLDEPTNHLDIAAIRWLETYLSNYKGTVLIVSHDRYFMNRTASRILSLTDRVMLNYPGSRSDEPAPDCYIGNYDYYLEKSAQVENVLKADERKRIAEASGQPASYVQTSSSAAAQAGSNPEEAPTEKATGGSLDYRKQKEEQARLRKQQNDLKKCESEISSLEERNTAIDEEMARPENCTDLAKLSKLQKEKSANEDRLAELYEKWEELSEALS